MSNYPTREQMSHSDNDIETPPGLVSAIIEYYAPFISESISLPFVLDPCAGLNHVFYNEISETFWCQTFYCEIKEGKDFFNFEEKVDWVIGNPPFISYRQFVDHSMEIADNICFIVTLNKPLGLKSIYNLMSAGKAEGKDFWGFKNVKLWRTPKSWPQSGIQIGTVWMKKNWNGPCDFDMDMGDQF
jgi:hypothetical protein